MRVIKQKDNTYLDTIKKSLYFVQKRLRYQGATLEEIDVENFSKQDTLSKLEVVNCQHKLIGDEVIYIENLLNMYLKEEENKRKWKKLLFQTKRYD